MNKICRVLAMILAVLMLVTMATACKQADDDEWDIVGNESSGFESDGDDDDGEGGSEVESDDPKNEGTGGKDDEKHDGKKDDEKDDGKKEDEKEEVKAPETQEEVVENYEAANKYEVTLNPLFAETKKPNTGYKPSFDIDSTGFVKNNVKLADLKGKTFTLITALKYGVWEYKNEKGETVDEWNWFEAMKGEYGVNVKYIASRYTDGINQILTYMNAGKALDLIPTHIGGFPQFLNLSQPLDPYINTQNMGNSPGVDQMTLEQTKYGGGYRCISPIGAVDVLFYNQSQVEEFGLQDPHTLWQQDKWDWNAWRNFVTSIPTTTSDGKPLTPYGAAINRDWFYWPMTNGVYTVGLDTENKDMNLINNWMDERTLQAMDFYTDVIKGLANMGNGKSETHMYTEGTITMASKMILMQEMDDKEYSHNRKYNWVPFPKSPYEDGQYVAFNIGYCMEIPKKVKTQSNIPYAVKFAELWATRFTEAMADYFATSKAYQWTYAQRKEYFEFAIKNTYFALQMYEWRFLTGANFDAMRKEGEGLIWAITDKNLNYHTVHTKVANVVEQGVKECVAFAQ